MVCLYSNWQKRRGVSSAQERPGDEAHLAPQGKSRTGTYSSYVPWKFLPIDLEPSATTLDDLPRLTRADQSIVAECTVRGVNPECKAQYQLSRTY